MSSTTYRQSPSAVLDTWLCLAAGFLFGGAGVTVVVSALLAFGADGADFARLGGEFGLVLGLLWCGVGAVGLWAAREIWRTTPRLVITDEGLSHWHGGLVTAFSWSEVELIHVSGGRRGRVTVVARHFDPYRIDTHDLRTSADAVAHTIRLYRPSAPIVR